MICPKSGYQCGEAEQIAGLVQKQPGCTAPPGIRAALLVLLNHVEPGFDNCKWVVRAWLDGRLDDTPKPSEEER